MSADVLRRAAKQLRTDGGVGYERGHISKRECDFKFEVASWLDHHARHAETSEAFGDYDERHWQAPLVIARVYLGEPHPSTDPDG